MVTINQVKVGAKFVKNDTRIVVYDVMANEHGAWVYYHTYIGSFKDVDMVRDIDNFLEWLNVGSFYLKSA